MDDEALGIDSTQCDGCGLCAAVCPQAAILHRHEPAQRVWRGQALALSACDHAESGGGEGYVSCVHAFSARDLLHLHQGGIRGLVVSTGDCNRCPRGTGPRLTELITKLNDLLDSRGLTPLGLSSIPITEWRKLLSTLKRRGNEVPMTRRGLFKRSLSAAVDHDFLPMDLVDMQRKEPDPPALMSLPGHSSQMTPCAPSIDPGKCNGCDACARLCPHGAIEYRDSADQTAYLLDADRCTGCGICADVCDRHAVEIAHWAVPRQREVTLQSRRCRACGAPFHSPADHSSPDSLCRICDHADHTRNLYQVLQ